MTTVIFKTPASTVSRITKVETFNIETLKQKAKELLFTAPVWNSNTQGQVSDIQLFVRHGTESVAILKDEELECLRSETPVVFLCYPSFVDIIDIAIAWLQKFVDSKSVDPKIVAIVILLFLLCLITRNLSVAMCLVSVASAGYVWAKTQKIQQSTEPVAEKPVQNLNEVVKKYSDVQHLPTTGAVPKVQ